MMTRRRVLFQGSHVPSGRGRSDNERQRQLARPIAKSLGDTLIREGFDVVLTGARSLDAEVGRAAVAACADIGAEPRERIRTYPHGAGMAQSTGFGMVLEPIDKRWQDVRTFVVQEVDAVVGLLGGKGTSDVIQKAALAGKPVFPIAVAGGGARLEWERLKRAGYHNRTAGDLDFLADTSIEAGALAEAIAHQCLLLLRPTERAYSRRIFIVHGHDGELKNELARRLERLEFEPVILHEQPDCGRTLISKLRGELADVGFAFVLLTPDDVGAASGGTADLSPRARQNVVFEHGLMIGLLGPERVCAVLKATVEVPSDLSGVLYKQILPGGSLDSVMVAIIAELRTAGYEVDACVRLARHPRNRDRLRHIRPADGAHLAERRGSGRTQPRLKRSGTRLGTVWGRLQSDDSNQDAKTAKCGKVRDGHQPERPFYLRFAPTGENTAGFEGGEPQTLDIGHTLFTLRAGCRPTEPDQNRHTLLLYRDLHHTEDMDEEKDKTANKDYPDHPPEDRVQTRPLNVSGPVELNPDGNHSHQQSRQWNHSGGRVERGRRKKRKEAAESRDGQLAQQRRQTQ